MKNIDDAVEADEIEPSREFIEQNALAVKIWISNRRWGHHQNSLLTPAGYNHTHNEVEQSLSRRVVGSNESLNYTLSSSMPH